MSRVLRHGEPSGQGAAQSWFAILEYDGAGFAGWQLQPGRRTVQGELEAALCRLLGGEEVRVVASGRTDAGVHALGQLVSFSCRTQRDPRAMLDGLNALLPPDVGCRELAQAPPGFDARRAARAKLYRYVFLPSRVRSPLRRGRCWRIPGALDAAAMNTAAELLAGTHDFTSFRAAGSSVRGSVRTVRRAGLRAAGDELHLEIEGNGFLRHMVRIVAGSLVEVGLGRRPPGWMRSVIEARDRAAAGRTAPPGGLFLVRVWW